MKKKTVVFENPLMHIDEYERNALIAESKLKPFLTDDFLETLQLAARTFGWSDDFTEVIDFVNWCRILASKKYIKFEPLDYNKEN